ncbi:MAG: hypothetical protein AB7T37_07760 [Dehalococcoidia bacterium]
MPATLSATLAAAAVATPRRPAVLATVRRTRFGMTLLEWRRLWADDISDQPVAVAVNDSGHVILFRNNAGTDAAYRLLPAPMDEATANLGEWSTLSTTMNSGKQIALLAHPTNDEVIVLYGNGNDLCYRRSTDGGQNWGAATVIVTEASAIGHVGAAVRTSTGNICVFYQVGTSTLKRIRRTSGTWSVAGTTATPTFTAITGIAACHDAGDFAVVVTGEAPTSGIPGVWSYYMGDGNLPSNVWSTAVAVTEADTASGVSYAHPAIVPLAGIGFYLAFGETRTADVAGSRVYFATTTAPNVTSTEPAPLEPVTANGCAVALDPAGGIAFLATSRRLYRADYGDTEDVSDSILSVKVEHSTRSTRGTIVLSDRLSSWSPGLAGESRHSPAALLSPGHEILLYAGYETSAGAEYGSGWSLVVDAVRVHFDRNGQRLVAVDVSGPWEQLARWRVPQSWQTASGVLTRSELATRITRRAGVPLSQASNPRQPSYVWRTHQPSFAFVAGETGAAAMARLLAPTPDILRPDVATGGAIRSGEDPRWAALMRRMEPDYWWRLNRED